MDKKSLSIKKKLLIILFLSMLIIAFGICTGISIKYVYDLIARKVDSNTTSKALLSFLSTLISGAATIKLLMVLLRDYKTKKTTKTSKWYFDKVLILVIVVCIIAAVTLVAFCGSGEDMVYFYISLIMFPLMGIIISPNAAAYSTMEMKKWKSIFYDKGNLDQRSKSKDFYKIDPPVPFEKKIYHTTIKNQLLDFNVVTVMIVLFVFAAIYIITNDGMKEVNGIFDAIVHVKIKRATGFLFFGLIVLLTFMIPLIVYSIKNVIYKFKVIKNHEYIAYHAIVNRVNNYVLTIDKNGFKYKYNYCTCVGIKESKINNTEAILIFLPDDVLVFPVEK